MPDGNRSKKQACPIKVRTAFEFDPRKYPGRAFKRHDRFAPQGYSMLFQLTRGIGTDLGPVAASDDIRYPVLHHDGKIRPLIPLAECGNGFARIFEAVAVQTMMD